MTHSSETKDANSSAANYTSLVTLVCYGSNTKDYSRLQVYLPYSQNSKSSNKRQYRGQPLRLKAGPVGEAPRPVSFSPRISLRVSFAPPIAFTPCLIGGNTEPPATTRPPLPPDECSARDCRRAPLSALMGNSAMRMTMYLRMRSR